MRAGLLALAITVCAGCAQRCPEPEVPSMVCRPPHRQALPARILFAYGSAEIDGALADNAAFFDQAAPSLAQRDDVCGLVVVGHASPVCDPEEDREHLSLD